jgi:DNA processing protein
VDERSYWLGFSLFPGIGPAKFGLLLSHFGSAKEAWGAPLGDLRASKVGGKIPEQFVEFRNNFSIERYEEQLRTKDVSYFIVSEEGYPKQLAEIKKPPFVLYVKGNREILFSD